ncbi:MAG: hypothetical protein ACXWWT_08545 [Candidatus Deferrimicrobiaceae bacterium]
MPTNPPISPRTFGDTVYRRATVLQKSEMELLRSAGLRPGDSARVRAEIAFLKIFTADFIIQSIYGMEPHTRSILDRFYDRVFGNGGNDLNVVDLMPRFVLYADASRGSRGATGRSREIGEEFSNFCDDFLPEGHKVRMIRMGIAVHRAMTETIYRFARRYAVEEEK